MNDSELSLIGDIVRHLPVFSGFDLNDLTKVARDCTKHLSAPNGMHHTLHVISQSLPRHLRETAYALGCDIAAADGGVSPEEMRLLELLRHELDLDRLHAAAIERGARARYLSA
jgi:tellurite resistance protein